MVFTFPANVLISHLKAALRFVSSDESRPHIACLRIERHGREIRFMATDGFRMWMASAYEKDLRETHDPIHIARADAIRLATKMLDKRGGEISILTCPNFDITVRQGDNVSTFKGVDLARKELEYPPFARFLVPMVSESTPRLAISINGDYLADAAASFADICDAETLKKDGSCIRIFPGASVYDPVTVSAVNTPAIALIMPTGSETYEQGAGYVTKLMEQFTEVVIPSRKKKVV